MFQITNEDVVVLKDITDMYDEYRETIDDPMKLLALDYEYEQWLDALDRQAEALYE